MNQDIKKRWVEALRSGKYQQGRGQLRADGRWCCLGVLGDIAVADGLATWLDNGDGEFSLCDADSCDMGVCMPTQKVDEWAGLDGEYKCGKTSLLHLNDNGTPFSEIADLIEAHL